MVKVTPNFTMRELWSSLTGADSDRCQSKALLKQEQGEADGTRLGTCPEKEEKAQVSRAGNTLHHSLTWLVLQAFSLRGFNQGVLFWLNRFTVYMAMSHFITGEFVLNTPSLRRVLQLNYLSGSSGCRCLCPPFPPSSIKGIFTLLVADSSGNDLASGWQLQSSLIQCLNTLIPFHYSKALRYRSLLFNSPPPVWYLKAVFTVLVHLNK